MTGTNPDPTASQGDPPAGSGEPGTPANGAVPVVIPEGYVPRSELEKSETRARALQSEKDRLTAQLAVPAATPPPAATVDPGLGFDPDEFRRSLVRESYGAANLAATAQALRSEFPKADTALFDKAYEFASPEALRLAVQDSHDRVANAVKSEVEAALEKQRAELASQYGIPAGAPTGSATPTDGDPTPAQLNSMSNAEWDALEVKSPGIVQRILAKAG